MSGRFTKSLDRADRNLGFAFLFPGLLFLVVFLLGPIIYSIYMSLYEWKLFDLGKNKEFVGILNYTSALNDKNFLNAAVNTFLIVGVCLTMEVLLGFVIALALWNINMNLKIIHSMILLPMITAPVIVALIWRFILDPQFGIFNYFLRTLANVPNQAWLGEVSLVLPSIMVVDIWQMTSFVVLILYAGLMGVPADCVEAAHVDGASYPQVIAHIVLPYIAPLVLLVMMLRTMDLFKVFDTVYVLTRGGPSSASETLSTFIYKAGFQHYKMGYAMALSLISLLIILVVSIAYLKLSKVRND